MKRGFRQFCKVTTLHGFKYLCSPYYFDRAWWVAWCAAGAACAGALCAVLWARFLQAPALLAVQPPAPAVSYVPTVAVCVSPHRVAHLILENISIKPNRTQWLPVLLDRILRRKRAASSQMELLHKLLVANNTTLGAALARAAPPCAQLVRACAWLRAPPLAPRDCARLFHPQLTAWGTCCLMEPHLTESTQWLQEDNSQVNKRMQLLLNCSNQPNKFGCEFYTSYAGEQVLQSYSVMSGRSYLGQLAFSAIRDDRRDRLLERHCVSAPPARYNQEQCSLECMERRCGCSDPLRPEQLEQLERGGQPLPPCNAARFACLLERARGKQICECKPSCQKIMSVLTIDSSPLSTLHYSFDSVYVAAAADPDSLAVLNLLVRVTKSKIFNSLASETWITLMSSLGGVFNMFLGVGFISALELIFWGLIKLPSSIRNSSEMDIVIS